MKKLIIHLCLLGIVESAFCQEDIIQSSRKHIDSLLTLISSEPDQDKRLDYVLSIYQTSSDGFPVLLLETYQKLYVIGEKNKDPVALSSAWSFAGQAYRLLGDYIKALDCHHKAVAIAETTNNPSLLGYAQNQMAHIYKDREENEKAFKLYKTAAENIAKGNIESLRQWPMMNLGAVYLNDNQLDSSLAYSTRALELNNTYHLLGYQDYLLSNIASVYSRKGELEKANDYFMQAIALAEASRSPRFMNNIYQSVAEHFYNHQSYDSAILYAKKAIAAVQYTTVTNLSLKPAKLLTDIYEHSNADSTLKYLRVYRNANDSLFSTRANQQLQMMTFEEEQRERNIAADKVNYQNKIRTTFLLTGLGVFCVIALVLYRNNKQKQKANKELEKTLADLKQTQVQLIQSEKMASLGELTAGIAHEIQNPLNFVNNFSEINTELITELNEEMEKGNLDEVKQLIKDISANEEKIHHHGKRADSIVKGMLQHSRKSNGQKEPTDLNELCDECIRLSYHGLRAKDKTFNAGFETDFDNNISKISILPQEIGRVLLNLCNNAFYATNERKKTAGEDYQPMVTVQTSAENAGGITIRVSDNGTGIPPAIREKIFQPFFTTKPTGEGTGLGLSLSYDIVTKSHTGTISVTSEENKGTTFTIYLPYQPS